MISIVGADKGRLEAVNPKPGNVHALLFRNPAQEQHLITPKTASEAWSGLGLGAWGFGPRDSEFRA